MFTLTEEEIVTEKMSSKTLLKENEFLCIENKHYIFILLFLVCFFLYFKNKVYGDNSSKQSKGSDYTQSKLTLLGN